MLIIAVEPAVVDSDLLLAKTLFLLAHWDHVGNNNKPIVRSHPVVRVIVPVAIVNFHKLCVPYPPIGFIVYYLDLEVMEVAGGDQYILDLELPALGGLEHSDGSEGRIAGHGEVVLCEKLWDVDVVHNLDVQFGVSVQPIESGDEDPRCLLCGIQSIVVVEV